MPRNIRLKKPPEGYFWRIEKQDHWPFHDEAVLYREDHVKSWLGSYTEIKRVGRVDLELYGRLRPDWHTFTDEEQAEVIFRDSERLVKREYRKNNLGEHSIELVD